MTGGPLRLTRVALHVAEPLLLVSRPLPAVLCLHTGGTLGMDPEASYEPDAVDGHVHLKPGTGGSFSPKGALRPGQQPSTLPVRYTSNPVGAGLRLRVYRQQLIFDGEDHDGFCTLSSNNL